MLYTKLSRTNGIRYVCTVRRLKRHAAILLQTCRSIHTADSVPLYGDGFAGGNPA